jgi:hypothetical protein
MSIISFPNKPSKDVMNETEMPDINEKSQVIWAYGEIIEWGNGYLCWWERGDMGQSGELAIKYVS